MLTKTKGYNVYRNDILVEFIPCVLAHAACKRYILWYGQIGTHMGQWKRTLVVDPARIGRTCYEYEYATTVGVYYRFQPATQE
jgi:hypothetical protein